MSSPQFGLSNVYLKVGLGLVLLSVTAIALTLLLATDSSLQSVTQNIGGVVLLSGAIIYFIGRVQKARATT